MCLTSGVNIPAGHSQYILVGGAAPHPKMGVLGTDTSRKMGVLGTGTSRNRGVLRTGLKKSQS